MKRDVQMYKYDQHFINPFWTTVINSMPLVITSPPVSPIFPFLLSLVFFLFHV